MKLNSRLTSVLVEFFGTLVLSLALLSIFYDRLGLAFFQAITLGFTLGLLLMLFPRDDHGYFNPAITIAKWTTRQLQTPQTLFYIAAQVLAGVVAWTLGNYLLGEDIANLANQDMDWRIFTAEALGAAVLAFGIAKAEATQLLESSKALLVGGLVVIAIILAGNAGNGIVNPAVALGIQSISFAYVAGPILGAIIGYNLFGFDSLLLKNANAKKPAAKKKPARKAATKTAKTPGRTKRRPARKPRLNSVRAR